MHCPLHFFIEDEIADSIMFRNSEVTITFDAYSDWADQVPPGVSDTLAFLVVSVRNRFQKLLGFVAVFFGSVCPPS